MGGDTPTRPGWMPRCILITPSEHYDHWLANMAHACVLQGYELIVHHADTLEPAEGEDRRVILTTNTRWLEPAPVAPVAVITTGVRTAAPQTEILTGAQGIYKVIDASKMLAAAVTYPGFTLITDAVVRESVGPLEILPGFMVEPIDLAASPLSNSLDLAAAAVFSIYARGPAPVGASCQLSLDLFHYETRREAERPAIQIMDLTGPPRVLVHGPDLMLTGGRWELTARFSLDEDAGARRYSITWGVGEDVVSFDVKPGRSGIFDITLSHAWDRPVPAEMRLGVIEGAMSGRFEFISARVKRIA